MKVNVINGELSQKEIEAYIKYGEEKYREHQIKSLDITIDGEYVDLKFTFSDTDFQHSYRSTDYLVNSMDKLNDAKQMEFSQKEHHTIQEN